MLRFFGIVFGFLTIGEVVAWLCKTAVPGPVWGLLLLLIALVISGKPSMGLYRSAERFLANMSFYFVPAGVGVLTQLDVIKREWAVLLVVIVGSTFVAQLLIALFIRAIFGARCKQI